MVKDGSDNNKLVNDLTITMREEVDKIVLGNIEKQMKPKFKMTKDEMLDFNDDCINAATQCPGFSYWKYEDREILKGEVKPKELVKYWLNLTVLFDSGYFECLSLDALEVFKEYKKYKKQKRAWKEVQQNKKHSRENK